MNSISLTRRLLKVRFSGSLIYLESLQHVFKLKFTKILQVAPITCHSSFFWMVVMSQLHWIIRASQWFFMSAARSLCTCQAHDDDVTIM